MRISYECNKVLKILVLEVIISVVNKIFDFIFIVKKCWEESFYMIGLVCKKIVDEEVSCLKKIKGIWLV